MKDNPNNERMGYVTGTSAPLPHERKVEILKILPGTSYHLLVTNWNAESILVHWDGKRDVPHLDPRESCPWCAQGWKPKWAGWLGAWIETTQQYRLVPITAHAVLTCPYLDPKSGVELRGRVLMMRRIGAFSNSPVRAEVSKERRAAHLVPAEIDVLRAMEVHYGLARGALGVSGEQEPPREN